MSAAKKGLGRGFDSLIPADLIDDSFNPNSPYDTTATQDERLSQSQLVALDRIHADASQPRRHFDQQALNELAGSIKEHGLLQPIIVTPKDDGFEIVAGERRYRASKLAGLTKIPVIIRTLTNQVRLEVSLIENIQRRDLNSIETATAYAKLRDQFNLSNDQIAERVQKSTSSVINTMRLLKLPPKIIALLADGTLSEGQARPLIGLDEKSIAQIVPRIVHDGWSARKVEQYITSRKQKKHAEASPSPISSGTTAATQQSYEQTSLSIKTHLQSNVSIRANSKGAGKIVIDFKNADDFERITKLLTEN